MRVWSGRLDLVAPADLPRFGERHVADSLRLLPLERSLPAGPAADVGSGAGLPGVPLAIAASGRFWRLIERRRARAAFLEEAVRVLELNCEVVVADARDAARAGLGGAHALATARAVATPGPAFGLLAPLLAPGGVAAVMVGAGTLLPEKARLWAPGIAILRAGRQGELAGGDRDSLESSGNH